MSEKQKPRACGAECPCGQSRCCRPPDHPGARFNEAHTWLANDIPIEDAIEDLPRLRAEYAKRGMA